MLRRAIALSLEGHKEEPCFETGLIMKEISDKIKETKKAQKNKATIVSRKSLLKRGTAMFFPGARKCKYSAILISEGMLYKNEMSQEKDTTCLQAGVKFRNHVNIIT